MPYPAPTAEQLRQFNDDGFLVVENAIDPQELDALVRMAQEMIERPVDPKANDWDWRKGEPRENRAYRIVQSAVDRHYPWLVTSAFRTWAARFGGLLMQQELEFWYEQFLGKPSATGAPTPWHQDEASWGRTLRDRGLTCWTAFHSVGPENGCMHFVPGGHKRPARAPQSTRDGERPADLRRFAGRRGRRLPDRRGHGDFSSQRDAAHDHRQFVGPMAPGAHTALPQSGM